MRPPPSALNLNAPSLMSNVSVRLTGPLGQPMELTWGKEYRPSTVPDVATLLSRLQNGDAVDDTQKRNQVAMCVTDPVRDDAGLRSARRHVLDALGADLLLYTSSPTNPVLRGVMSALRPRLFAKAPTDNLTPEQFRADLQPYTEQYKPFAGSVSPAACNSSAKSAMECAHALSIYVGQQRCLDMVQAAEKQRGKAYDWVLWSRGELRWVVDHPPVHLLSKDRVWIPQCSSDYFGMYDRHVAMPRALADKYLSRYRMLKSGEMLSVLQQPRRVRFYGDIRFSHNSESMLHAVLEAKGVAIGRFPCAAALTCCTDCVSNGCCTATFRTADGSLQTFQVSAAILMQDARSAAPPPLHSPDQLPPRPLHLLPTLPPQAKTHGERPPEGLGSGAEGPTVWDEQGPPTSLEGFWAASQAGCAGRGDAWHAAVPCEEQRNREFVDAPGFVKESYVSLCSDTCLRSSALQCKPRDASPQLAFRRNATGADPSASAALPQVEPPWWEPLEEFQIEPLQEQAGREGGGGQEGVQEEEEEGPGATRQHAVGPLPTRSLAQAAADPDPDPDTDIDRRATGWYTHAIPAGVPCGHAIFLAGMPRAGSTLQVLRLPRTAGTHGSLMAPTPPMPPTPPAPLYGRASYRPAC